MYEEDPTLVRNIVADGCEKADKLAQETMRDVREAMGLDYSYVWLFYIGLPLAARAERLLR